MTPPAEQAVTLLQRLVRIPSVSGEEEACRDVLAAWLSQRGLETTVYAKFEIRNFTGSIKDRMALHIMESAYRSGAVQPGDTIAEATSGNTGIAFAAIGRALGHPVVIYMPDWMSQERVQLIRSFGASIEPVSKQQGGFLGSIDQFYQKLADELKGVARASLVSATALSEDTVEKIRAALSNKTNKEIILEVEQDPELIGGIVTQIGDLVWDGSIKTQLSNMRETLKRGEGV